MFFIICKWLDYINFAKVNKGKDFEYIIIGLDFFGTNLLSEVKIEKPKYYIDTAQSPFYRYKMLLSFSTLKKSLKNIKNYLFEHPNKITESEIKSSIREVLLLDPRLKDPQIEISYSNDYQYCYINITVYVVILDKEVDHVIELERVR